MSAEPTDIVIPNPETTETAISNVQKAQEVEGEVVEPCCSRLMSLTCFGVVGISFFVIFVTATSDMVFESGHEFRNGYVSFYCIQDQKRDRFANLCICSGEQTRSFNSQDS